MSGASGSHRALAQAIRDARKVVALTGAGISVPSGIPDFRTPGTGRWADTDPMKVAHIKVFHADPQRFWDYYRQRLDLHGHQPNPAHRALTDLQQAGRLAGIITQNVDGLHHAAGTRNIAEMHGTLSTVSCPLCRTRTARNVIEHLFDSGGVPRCPDCEPDRWGHPPALKPDVVLFGENLPEAALDVAEDLIDGCDLLLCIGSTLQVWPVAGYCERAVMHGGRIAIWAKSATGMDHHATWRFRGDVARQLPQTVRHVLA